MPTQLKASLKLDLQDQLTAGLERLEKQLDRLRNLAGQLGLTELEDGLDRLRGGAGSVDNLTKALRGTESQADRAAGAIKRMAQSANDNVIRVGTDGVARLGRAFGAIAGGGGGGDASFFDSPLLLGGPGSAGGIPLNLRPSRGAGLGAALGGVKSAVGGFGEAGSNLVNKGFGAAVEGFAVYEPIKQYAEFEQLLRQIGITEGKSGAELEADIKQLNELFTGDALHTGQSSASIARAYKKLIGIGLPIDVTREAIGIHSEAATAYGIAPDEMDAAVGALLQNLKVPVSELGGAIAAMAEAAQKGSFKIDDFSRELPGISGIMANLGITGRAGADQAFAALEIIRRSASQSGQAAANYFDALNHLTAPRDQRNFKKVGFDLPAILRNAEKTGKNPLEAVLDRVQGLLAGNGPVSGAIVLGTLFSNAQDKSAFLALLQHRDEFEALRKTLDGISKLKLAVDFASAVNDPNIQLANTAEILTQISRILGEGFLPVLTAFNFAMLKVLQNLTWMNTHMPVTTHVVLGLLAGMLALGAAITLIGAVIPAFVAGWGVVTAVFGAVAAVIGAISLPITAVIGLVGMLAFAAYGIYENWGEISGWFKDMWEHVKGWFRDFKTWVDGWTGGEMTACIEGIKSVWQGMTGWFENLIKDWEKPFRSFIDWIDQSKLGHLLGWDDSAQLAGARGGHAGPAAAPDDGHRVFGGRGGTMHVYFHPDPAAPISKIESDTPAAVGKVIAPPNTGKVLRRY